MPAFSQGDSPGKAKKKEFGKSLKSLKWDPKRNEAVQRKEKGKDPAPDDEDVVRVDTRLVVTDALVLDAKGLSVNGLTAKDFVITEEGIPQHIDTFSTAADSLIPRAIVMIMDTSYSLWPVLDASVEAAKKLVDQIRPGDRVAIVNDEVKLISDFTGSKAELKASLDRSKDREPTAGLGWERLRQRLVARYASCLMREYRAVGSSKPMAPAGLLQPVTRLTRPFPRSMRSSALGRDRRRGKGTCHDYTVYPATAARLPQASKPR